MITPFEALTKLRIHYPNGGINIEKSHRQHNPRLPIIEEWTVFIHGISPYSKPQAFYGKTLDAAVSDAIAAKHPATDPLNLAPALIEAQAGLGKSENDSPFEL